MPIDTSTLVDTLDANLNEIWLDGKDRWAEEYSKIFILGTSTKQSEKDSFISGFGTWPVKDQGSAAIYDILYQGASTTYVHVTYALGYELTEEAIEDNQHTPSTFNMLPQALMDGAIETVEILAANVINNGLAASVTGFDGVALFATNHPLLGGGTQSNTPSTQADLSVTALTSALQAIEDMVDERGKKARTIARLLVVPTANQWIAEELLKSGKKPYTANNEINAILTKDLTYFIYHYMTDSDAWVILAQKEKTKLKFWWRSRLGDLRRGTDFDSTNLKHLGRMRISVGYSHYIGTYGSTGA